MQGLKRIATLMMAVITFGAGQAAYASIIGSPMALRGVIEQIHFSEPTLAPMAYTMFRLFDRVHAFAAENRVSRRLGSDDEGAHGRADRGQCVGQSSHCPTI